MDINSVIDTVIISSIEEYAELKDSRYWDFYIAGISYGIFLTCDKTLDIDSIKNRIENGIRGYLN